MSDLGKKLKEAREAQKLSVSEISLSTKIGARMIKALEEGDHKALPALPFAKGFVRSYAAYLKLDQDEMVRIFLEEMGEGLAPAPTPEEIEEKEAAVSSSASVEALSSGSSFSRFMILGGVLALILAVVGVKSLVEKYKREGEVSEIADSAVIPIEKEETSESLEAAEKAAEMESASESAAKDPKTTVEASEAATTVSESPSTKSAVAPKADLVKNEPPKQELPKPEAPQSEPQKTEPQKVEEKKAEVTPPTPVKEETPTTTEAAATAGPEEKPSSAPKREVLIEALDKVRVSINLGGTNQVLNLEAGEVHLLRSSEAVVLDISDGGAVNLVVNGRSRGVPGSLGQAKKVRFP